MKFSYNTKLTLPKKSKRSRSGLQDASRSLRLFWKEKKKLCLITEKIQYSKLSISQALISQSICYIKEYSLDTVLTFVSFQLLLSQTTGPSRSKLTTSLFNVSLNFQKLISQICQYFLLKKFEKLLQCKSFSNFFIKKFQCIWL